MLHRMASPDECRLFLMIDPTSDLADLLKTNRNLWRKAMNKREKYVWNQMQTFLKTSYKDSEAQQYIHSAQARHTHWMSNNKGGFSVTAENDSEHDSPACGTLRCPERGWTRCGCNSRSIYKRGCRSHDASNVCKDGESAGILADLLKSV